MPFVVAANEVYDINVCMSAGSGAAKDTDLRVNGELRAVT